jgi:hypothetical protein
MKRELHVIISEGEREDVTIYIRQFGKRLVITTEREGVASSVLRAFVENCTGKDKGKEEVEPKESCIGFQTEADDTKEPIGFKG